MNGSPGAVIEERVYGKRASSSKCRSKDVELMAEENLLGQHKFFGFHRVRERAHIRPFTTLRAPQVMLNLHAKPEFGGRAQRGGKTKRHSGGDPGMPVENSGQVGPSDTQTSSRLFDAHLAQVIPKDFARVAGLKII
jgi:hypothetical protein